MRGLMTEVEGPREWRVPILYGRAYLEVFRKFCQLAYIGDQVWKMCGIGFCGSAKVTRSHPSDGLPKSVRIVEEGIEQLTLLQSQYIRGKFIFTSERF